MRSSDAGLPAEAILSQLLSESVVVNGMRPVGGGCINKAVRVDTSAGVYFIKTNSADRYPQMFETEARSLNLLRSSGCIAVPSVTGVGATSGQAWLVLEWVEPGKRKTDFFADFGRRLACLHRKSNSEFGLDHDNYIGSLPQHNRSGKSGAGFFIEQRLAPQLNRALSGGGLDPACAGRFERLYKILPGLLPEEPPALLHGDLWSGNFMTGPGGEPVLIDPAAYYGLRETDLAMTLLFGGFDPVFYEAYNESFPLQAGWQERMELYNLYPLLVHVNLFGGGYTAQVKAILNRFT